MVGKDPAHPAAHLAVRNVEILLRPLGIPLVIVGAVRIAGRLHRRVKVGRILRIGDRRIEVGPAAEPCLGGSEEAGVHVHCGHMRVRHMRDKADACRNEPGRVGAGTVDRACKFLGEATANGRDIDPDLLEHLALHQALHPAAGIGIALLLAVPRGQLECGVRPRLALNAFEFSANLVAQKLEPRFCARGFVRPIHKSRSP